MGRKTSNEYSNESFLKETSNEYQMNKKRALQNHLSVKERDYMISKAMQRLAIDNRYQSAVAKAANYIEGDRFWQIFEYAQKAHSPAHYFIKAINKELYAS
jgi:hypothetical protein